jgi:hypothetical protein
LGQSAALQGECRIPKKIFRYGEVFNTSVDKFVKNSRPRTANFSLFNVLARFAQYLCNKFCIASQKKSTDKCMAQDLFVWNQTLHGDRRFDGCCGNSFFDCRAF